MIQSFTSRNEYEPPNYFYRKNLESHPPGTDAHGHDATYHPTLATTSSISYATISIVVNVSPIVVIPIGIAPTDLVPTTQDHP